MMITSLLISYCMGYHMKLRQNRKSLHLCPTHLLILILINYSFRLKLITATSINLKITTLDSIMDSDHEPLHILLFPFLAQGHILPTIDLAKLFASRGVKTTIVTTAGNASLFQQSIAGYGQHRNPIHLSLIPFPSGTGLPEGCENMYFVPQHLKQNFFEALEMLRQPFDRLLRDLLPDCVVAGMFLYWIYDVATELDIPMLEFHGSNLFAKCAFDSVGRHKILESSCEEHDSVVVIPDLAHRIEMRRSLIPDFSKAVPFIVDLMNRGKDSGSKSHGLIVNSFYELEPDYVEYYKKVVGRKAWLVGPLSLCNEDAVEKLRRGSMATADANSCLKWLDGKSPRSVVYVCFGTASYFTVEQLHELALGLEASNHSLIWVVRNGGEDALPKGFEGRVGGRGLVIRGWAPQIAILNHEAVGGFLTHCGWNSSLEAISAGLPLITWPLFAEQTYNERLIVDVLKIGVAVGVKNFAFRSEERMLVDAAAVEEAVNELMGESEEAEERRRRAEELGEMAKRAMEKGGASCDDMSNLIEELKGMRNIKFKHEEY